LAGFGCLVVTMMTTAPARAQDASPAALTLRQAVELALARHPAVRAGAARVEAAGEERAVARSAYLPEVDLLWQQNRGTRSNVYGLLLPQSVVPGISGPVQDDPSPSSVWGSAAGAHVDWEVFDFGRRSAAVDAASAQLAAAAAREALTDLDVGVAAAAAFVSTLAADERVSAAQANLERVEVFQRSVSVLVENQLRPGVDGARASAELAGARIQLVEAEHAAAVARLVLAEAIGIDGPVGGLDAGRLLEPVLPGREPDVPVEQHPAARIHEAEIETSLARASEEGKRSLPSVDVQSTVFARGSGAVLPGVDRDGSGLWPDVSNWAVGLTVTIPVLETVPSRARRRRELASARASEAAYEEAVRHLRTEEASARALEEAAGQIAANTPTQLGAARAAVSQATGRYDAGLSTVTEVADAQRVLVQAEVDDALARLGIWTARLAVARSTGDLASFLSQLGP
jgi:outer membrane protein TolC